MLCQIFESVPGTLVIHEPNPPHNLVHLQRSGIISDDLYEGLLKSIIRVLCKAHPGTERICVKPRPICTSMMMDVSRLFPDIKQIFIYRNCMNTVQSWLAVMRYDAFHVVIRACADDAWQSCAHISETSYNGTLFPQKTTPRMIHVILPLRASSSARGPNT